MTQLTIFEKLLNYLKKPLFIILKFFTIKINIFKINMIKLII